MTKALIRLLHLFPPETAHRITVQALATGFGPRHRPDARLQMQVAGLDLRSPIGMAAGFDKDGEAISGLLRAGFGFVEAGTVTPKPQPGNPKPRLFRLSRDRAVINRMGFNNSGLDAFADRLKRLPPPGFRWGPVGANIGANKDSADRIADYRIGAERLVPLADYITVNISSPNTPGLRTLQEGDSLPALLSAVLDARAAADTDGRHVPVFVKIAPDLDGAGIDHIAEVVKTTGLDGVIATNTTTARPDNLKSRHKGEAGGLSGTPLTTRADAVVARLYQKLGPDVPIIGVGGLASGADVYRRMRLGARAVQLYSALVYEGPSLVPRIERDLLRLMDADAVSHIDAVIGQDADTLSLPD